MRRARICMIHVTSMLPRFKSYMIIKIIRRIMLLHVFMLFLVCMESIMCAWSVGLQRQSWILIDSFCHIIQGWDHARSVSVSLPTNPLCLPRWAANSIVTPRASSTLRTNRYDGVVWMNKSFKERQKKRSLTKGVTIRFGFAWWHHYDIIFQSRLYLLCFPSCHFLVW